MSKRPQHTSLSVSEYQARLQEAWQTTLDQGDEDFRREISNKLTGIFRGSIRNNVLTMIGKPPTMRNNSESIRPKFVNKLTDLEKQISRFRREARRSKRPSQADTIEQSATAE